MLRMIMECVSRIGGKGRGREKSLSAPNAEKGRETPASMRTATEVGEDLGAYEKDGAFIKFKNDSERLRLEFDDLRGKNKPLQELLWDLAAYTTDTFNKTITITMIGRTQKEQDNIYAGKERNGVPYKDRPWKSPHQFAHAVDLRSRDFTDDEIRQIEDYLNAKYNQDNYYSFTAKDHNVGLGDHFHLQYYKV